MIRLFSVRKFQAFPHNLSVINTVQPFSMLARHMAGLLLILNIVFVLSCTNKDGNDVILSEKIDLNPSGYAPLSAAIHVRTKEKFGVRLRVVGQDGTDSDILQEFPALDTTLNIPVHGLYAGSKNTVELAFFDEEGKEPLSIPNPCFQPCPG